MKLRVALDQNFPTPIVTVLASAIVEVDLDPLTQIDRRLAMVDDDVLIHALAFRGYEVLATCDARMLDLPSVLATVVHTKMTVVVAMGQGDDHVAASGLLLAHLPHVAAMYRADHAQVWRLRVGRKGAEDPRSILDKLVERKSAAVRVEYEQHRASLRHLAGDPLSASTQRGWR